MIHLLALGNASAQLNKTGINKTSEGTDFWVCFQENSWHHSLDRVGKMKLSDPRGGDVYVEDRSAPNFELFISSDITTKIRIEIIGIRYKLDTMVVGGTVRRLKIPSTAEVTGDGTLQPNAVHITADAPITVTCLNERGSSTDSYLALPATALGLDYYAMSYSSTPTNDLVSHMAIVATQDSTLIQVTPSVVTSRNRAAKVPFTVIMNKGDVYQIAAMNFQPMTINYRGGDSVVLPDMTGTRVQASKPIAVFSGHQCADVPIRVPFCNYLVEQLPPVQSWGKHFILGQFAKRTSYAYRVLASKPNTKIFENSVFVRELQAGEMYENSSVGSRNIMLTANEPVLVAQFSHGYLGGSGKFDGRSSEIKGDSIGDPMMLVVSPSQQFLKEYRFATPKTSYTNWRHYINIIAPHSAVGSIRINGRSIDTIKNFPQYVGLSNYVSISTDIPFGVHTVTADVPFGLYSYGFATNDAYGNMIGQGFEVLKDIRDTLPPTFERRNLDRRINLVIRDERSNDKGLKSVRILSAQGLVAIENEKTTSSLTINQGMPQYTLYIKPQPGIAKGKMEIEAQDMEGNISTYILEYDGTAFLSALEEKPVQSLNNKPRWQWGVHTFASSQFHSIDSAYNLGRVFASQGFQAESGSPIGIGIQFTNAASSTFATMIRAEYSANSLTLRGRDSNSMQVFDSASNAYLPFQEAFIMQPTLPTISFSAGLHINLHPLLYTFASVQSTIILSRSAEAFRVIEQPVSYHYVETGTRELSLGTKTIDELSILWLSGNIGLGIQKNITPLITVFGESQFNYTFQSLLAQDKGNWKFSSLRFTIGMRTAF